MDIKPLSDVELNNTEASRGSSPSEPSLLVRDDEVFIRMTPIERLQHITLILCFVLLVLTGLPLLLDPAMWLKKLFFFETSFAWRGWIHRIAGVGLIALSGILMRNTLILIGQIRENERSGMDEFSAVVEATVQRARPVILTALAAVLAFIPLTHSVFWGTLAYTLIGGTLAGTVLTLVFLPAMYAIWFKIHPTLPARV